MLQKNVAIKMKKVSFFCIESFNSFWKSEFYVMTEGAMKIKSEIGFVWWNFTHVICKFFFILFFLS